MLVARKLQLSGDSVVKNQVQSRRKHKRIDDPKGVWVYWRCGHSEDTSRVRDISVGGIFIETQKKLSIDAIVELNFLVEDGGIVAKAAVRYLLPGVGVGLQFENIRTEDQPHFVAMMKRIISSG
jgi:PilZ domain